MYDVISLVDASLPGMFPARPYATRVETTNRIPLAGAQRSHMPLSMCPSYEEWREHLPPAPGPKSSAVCYVRPDGLGSYVSRRRRRTPRRPPLRPSPPAADVGAEAVPANVAD